MKQLPYRFLLGTTVSGEEPAKGFTLEL